MDLVNRLKIFLERRQIAISQFADTCRIPRPTVSQILNGRNKKISDELITKIHEAYPDLSVLWLMFGEGEMTTNANTRFSEPQNGPISTPSTTQHPLGQRDSTPDLSFNDVADEESDKFPDLFSSTMGDQNAEPTHQTPDPTPKTVSQPLAVPKKDGTSITFNADANKKITNIVVFYNDNSFESFSPSPA